tara:strand:+ start:3659 stop:4327 length:669 start_codon:yes stop_codon:yes gene_type:complete
MKKYFIIIILFLILSYFIVNLEILGPGKKHKYSIKNRSFPSIRQKLFGVNKEKHRENLKIVGEILKKNKIDFFLSDGTALGAIRENDIIEGDEDVDIEIDIKYLDKFISIMEVFQKNEFNLMRYWLDTPLNSDKKINLISFHRDYHYVDFQFSGKGLYCISVNDNPPRLCDEFLHLKEPHQFKKIEDIEYKVPSDKYLELLYGKDWKKPKRNFKPHHIDRNE